MPALDRGKLITKLAALMREHAETLARLEAINTGIPIRESRLESRFLRAPFRVFRRMVRKSGGQRRNRS